MFGAINAIRLSPPPPHVIVLIDKDRPHSKSPLDIISD